MRCQACDYELWHCTGRTCTECGARFSLANFIFEKNTVLFHCPHCDHGIEGEAPTGRPLLSINQCEVCGLEINYENVIVRPIVGVDEKSLGSLLPIRLNEGNRFTRYFSTVLLVMTKPQIAISRVPVQEPLWNAWKFYLTTMFVTIVFSLLPISFLYLFASPDSNMGLEILRLLTVVVMQCVLMCLFLGIYILMWSLLTHALLQITGGSSFTLRRTLQAVLYSGGVLIVGIIPCLGSIAGFIWWLVAAINMIIGGQRVSGGRASFATLTGPLLIFVFVCGGYIMLMTAAMAPIITKTRTAVQQSQQQQTSQVVPVEESATNQLPE